jgi:hypothetical protein
MAPTLFREFCGEFQRELNRLRGRENADLEMRRAQLARIGQRVRKLVALITEDDAPVKALKAELRTLETQQADLEKELNCAPAPQPLLHPNLAEVYVKGLRRSVRRSTIRPRATKPSTPFAP